MPATGEERLVLHLEARVRQFERAMQKASRDSQTAAGRIRGNFARLERDLAGFGRGLARDLLAPFAAIASARAIGQAADAYTRIQNSLKVAGLEGEALAAVFDRLFGAAQRNAAPVESLVELYSRAALVQGELGVSTEELLRFTEGVAAALRVSGQSAAESSGALLQLAQALGSGTVRAEEFNSILEGALPVAQAMARGLEEAGGSVAKLRQIVIDGRLSSEAAFRAFEAGQGTLESLAATTEITLGGAFTRLRNTLIRTVGQFDATVGASDRVAAGLESVSFALEEVIAWFDRLASSPVGQVISQFNELANALERFTPAGLNIGGAVRTAADSLDTLNNAAKNAWGEIEAGAGDAADEAETAANRIAQAFADAGEAAKPVSLRDFAPPPARGGGAGGRGGGRSAAISEAEREAKAVSGLIAELQREYALVGATDTQRRISNELRQAGAAATEEQKAQIADLINAIAAEEQAQQRLIEAMDEIRFTAADALSSFNDELRRGAGLGDALKSALERVLDTIIRIAEQQFIAALFGAPGGTGGGAFSGIAASLFGGGRAAGGPVSPGKFYTVGERGPETFIPRVPGAIIPNGGTQRIENRISVDVAPSPLFITTVRQTQQAAISANNRRLPGIMAEQQARYG